MTDRANQSVNQYCEVDRRLVRRIKDGKKIAWAFDKKHAQAIAKRFNKWATLGWPPTEE